MNKTLKRNDASFWLVSSILLLLLLILWVHTLIKMLSFLEVYNEFELLYTAFITMILAGLAFGLISGLDFSFFCRSTYFCIIRFSLSLLILLGLYCLETKTDVFSLFASNQIILRNWTMDKIHLLYVFLIIWFPANITWIFKAMEKEKFNRIAATLGIVSVCVFTLEEMLLCNSLANGYKVDMIILNTITIGIAMWKHGQFIPNRQQIIFILLYLILRIGLLPLCTDRWGADMTLFMQGVEKTDFPKLVHEVVTHAALLGTSKYLMDSEFVVTWLFNQNVPVLQVLYYGGWIAGILYVASLLALTVCIIKNLNLKKGRNHRCFLIYASAASCLVMEIVLGILMNFGVPFFANIPFFNGYWSFIMLALVFICGIENHAIQENESFVPLKNILKKPGPYIILDEDGNDYNPDNSFEYVTIHNKHFKLERCDYEQKEFAILTTMSFPFKQRCILESINNEWVETENAKILELAAKYYKYHNIPEYLEDTIYEEHIT
ncbi:MAG: hypothetical protein J6E46_13635 [Faecalicoccus sp.]|nr:hypothetical protein [Faecalicoccus sp.]